MVPSLQETEYATITEPLRARTPERSRQLQEETMAGLPTNTTITLPKAPVQAATTIRAEATIRAATREVAQDRPAHHQAAATGQVAEDNHKNREQ